jgi:hypothetical protein
MKTLLLYVGEGTKPYEEVQRIRRIATVLDDGLPFTLLVEVDADVLARGLKRLKDWVVSTGEPSPLYVKPRRARA